MTRNTLRACVIGVLDTIRNRLAPQPGPTAEPRPANEVFLRPGQLCPSNYGVPLNQRNGSKILVVSLPKSGGTWLLRMLADCLGLTTIPPRETPPPGTLAVTKAHAEFEDVRRWPDIAATVYLVRDLRDVVVSYYHYVKTPYYHDLLDPSAHYDSIEQFYYEYFLSRLLRVYRWPEQPEEYVAAGAPLLRYEDLWDTPEQELERLFRRWGIDVPEADIQQAVARNTIDRYQREGVHIWKTIPPSFARKGGHGGYHDELPAAVLEDINHRFGEHLRRWGYPLDPKRADGP